MKWAVLLLLAACSPRHWRDDPSRPPSGVVARLAIVHATHLRILEINPHGIQSTRTVELGKYASRLVWGGSEPAVMLSDTDPSVPPFNVPPAGMAFVGGDGARPFPDYAWPAVDTSEGAVAMHALVGHDGGTWEGLCTHALFDDGRPVCGDGAWTFVRQQPLPQVVSHDALVADEVEAPQLDAALQVTIEKREDHDHLRCTDGTRHVAFIPEDEPPMFAGMKAPVWLASEPPIFAANQTFMAYDNIEQPHIYVDCREDAHLSRWLASPSGVVAIYGERLDLVYGGKVVATTEGGELVAFAATASAPPAR